MRRRQFLASATGVVLASTAGCLRSASEAGQRPLSENPVGQNLADQPRKGAHHDETDVTLVEFSNPNCGSCASFHEDTFPTIESEWLATGDATFYSRTPSVTAWAEKAEHALEEARQGDEAAYWHLKDRYFADQDDLTTDNVVAKTRTFLTEADAAFAVDPDAVAAAAEEKPHTDALETDERAASDASGSIGFPTPTTFVFEDGEFVTTLGNVDFEQFETAVESDA